MAASQGTSEGFIIGDEAAPPGGIWRPPFGVVVMQGMIATRAFPWKVGKNTRQGATPLHLQTMAYQRLKSWATDVSMTLRVHGRPLLPQPVVKAVDLDVLFVLECTHSKHDPDRTNLLKAFEDILQGIAYLNDTQVQGGESRRVYIGEPIVGRGAETWDGPERIHFRVTSLA